MFLESFWPSGWSPAIQVLLLRHPSQEPALASYLPASRRAPESVTMTRAGGLCVVSVLLTSRCNLACTYCYQGVAAPQTMSPELRRRCLDLLFTSDAQHLELHFSGGEALLEFPALLEMTAEARARCPPDTRLTLALTTNGTLITDEIAAFLAREGFRVRVSFDGLAAAQDDRGAGSFPIVDQAIDDLLTAYGKRGARMLAVGLTLHRKRLPLLAKAMAALLEKPLKEIQITPVFTDDGPWDEEDERILEEQFKLIVELALRRYARRLDRPIALFNREPLDDAKVAEPCGAANPNTFVIAPDGRAGLCPLFFPSSRPKPPLAKHVARTLDLASIRARDFAKRLAQSARGARELTVLRPDSERRARDLACATCDDRRECFICPAAICYQANATDPRRVPAFHCAFNRITAAASRLFRARIEKLELPRGFAGLGVPSERARREPASERN